jgi:hypothetical protein
VKKLFYIFVLVLSNVTYGQLTPSLDSMPIESVTIDKDVRIAVLLNKKMYIPKTQIERIAAIPTAEKVKVDKYGRVNMPGFRVQVFNSTDRAQVYQTKGKLYQLYPNHKQYVIAQAPFFKLRFGNFTTRAEADKFRKALAPMFPAGVYVVPDIIEGQIKMEKKTPELEN